MASLVKDSPSTSSSTGSLHRSGHRRRIDAYRKLEEAFRLLRDVAAKGVSAAQVLQKLEEAEGKVRSAATVSRPTEFTAEKLGRDKGKVKRDGLPVSIRRKIEREAERLKALAQEVKRVPVTREQRLLADRKRGAAS